MIELSDVVFESGGDPSSSSSSSSSSNGANYAAVASEVPCHGGRGEYLDIGYDCVLRGKWIGLFLCNFIRHLGSKEKKKERKRQQY
jgi:hypothetical protein